LDDYHNLTNVRAGKGDPCRLIGMTLTEIANFPDNNAMLARETALANEGIGGWRLPTDAENIAFAPAGSTTTVVMIQNWNYSLGVTVRCVRQNGNIK